MENIKENSIIDSKPVSSIKLFIIDFFLLNISFFLCYFLKRGHFDLSEMYVSLLCMFYLCWFISSIMGNKFKSSSLTNYGAGIKTFLKSSLYLTYLITFLVVIFGLVSYSRIHIFSTCIMIFILDVLFWSMYNKVFTLQKRDEVYLKSILTSFKMENNIAYSLVIMDLLLAIVAFFIVNYLKRGHFELLPDYPKLFMIFLGLWFLTSAVTMKFSIARFQSIYFFAWQWIKAGGMMLAIMTILIFGLRLFAFSRFQALGSITLMVVLEIILISFYYKITQYKETKQDIESFEKVKSILTQDDLPLDVNIDTIQQKMMEPARNKFKKQVGSKDPELFKFMDQHIALDDIMRIETSIDRSSESFDLDLDRVPVRLFFNLLRMNDIKRINTYFLKMHKLLVAGGYYVGYAHTINTHYDWIYKKFPKYIAGLVYLADFCFSRILPKLPGFQKIYFAITNGKGRVLSKAELLGRLSFCGFKIIAEKEIDQRVYVIARKVKTFSLDKSPTYGPLVQLKRLGERGQIVHLYKFRTMHPYSEYLQQYIFDIQGLKKGGKIKDDFRVTNWGKTMRKFWLDELPTLYNWLKGELSLVGVRPLSFHYLSLYDKDLQELRKRVKPGLVPPFYVDLPNTFEEICASEKKYIESFLKHPVRTQCIYFWKAFVNIVIKGVRSG